MFSIARHHALAALTLMASLACACAGTEITAPGDAETDAPVREAGPEAGGDSTADADSGEAPDAVGEYAAYCAKYLDAADPFIACSAKVCCPSFAACDLSNSCGLYQVCVVDDCPDAGDADPQTALAECVDACTMQYPVGAQQFHTYIDCADMNCYE